MLHEVCEGSFHGGRDLGRDLCVDAVSFGVVLYELLAGKHPFEKDTAAATLTSTNSPETA